MIQISRGQASPVSFCRRAELFANAKCREDAIEDVVGSGGSGDGVEGGAP
jgi:hypothetical protein